MSYLAMRSRTTDEHLDAEQQLVMELEVLQLMPSSSPPERHVAATMRSCSNTRTLGRDSYHC